MEQLLLNPEQTAETLSVSEAYIRKLIRANELPVIRLGRKCVRIRFGELKAWIDSKAEPAGVS
jgi:excisionase family DNA binding protein